MAKFPHKPAAPSVRETVGPAIDRSRTLLPGEHPKTQQEIVLELFAKLDLPEPVKRRLRERHKLQ
jgi:hypothetical protein